MRWNKREVIATCTVSAATVALIFTAGMMVPNEPKVSEPVASAEKVELSTPVEALPVPIIDAVPPVSDLEETDPPPRPATPPSPPVEPPVEQYPTLMLVPCAQEDSVNCYWDATRMGNGLGTSFVNIDGVYYYAEVSK